VPGVAVETEPGADPELDTRLAAYPTIAYTTSQVLALYNADNRTIGVILDEFMNANDLVLEALLGPQVLSIRPRLIGCDPRLASYPSSRTSDPEPRREKRTSVTCLPNSKDLQAPGGGLMF